MEKSETVVVVGSGPAGLTAAIYLARANLNPLVIEGEEAGGQLMTTTDVENFPGFAEGIQGPELMVIMRKQAECFGTRFITRNVDRADLSQRPFQLWVGGDLYKSQAVIISTGASAMYLGLENEKKFLGRGVSACATCDGAFFKDQVCLVVGGGDTAMEEAQFLTRFASKVYVVHRRDKFRASKIMSERILNNKKVEVLWNTELKDVFGDKEVEAVELYNNQTKAVKKLSVSGVFIAIGHRPNVSLFQDQLKTNSVGYIETESDSTRTSVEGVFAAGDVQDSIYRQAVTAAGTGCMAAMDCERWLESQGK